MSLRVGIVGWGDAGRIHAKHLAAHGARLVGVVSRRPPGTDFPWFRSLEDILPEVDALTIAAPNDLHAGMVLKAVQAGKSVMVEKPLCITRDELRQLELVLPSANVLFHLGYRLRFNDEIRRLRRPKDDWAVPRRVHCSYQLGIDRLAAGKSWIRDPARSGGPFFVLGTHCHDLVRWLCRARGRALTNLAVPDKLQGDFPLQVSLMGWLGETELGISVDMRGNADYRLQITVEWLDEQEPRSVVLSGERPGVREEAEYAGLIGNFVQAAEQGLADPVAITEILQTHRELFDARDKR
ncbi:MAG: Gfo/Idh/MocA family oxidoreductase [Gammaproteobacteria bacterium]|nr:Gfo/Idh/MocA family oxidoreductase [Gammaproteobacteria bacterium]